MTDEELNTLRQQVLAEQERRDHLAAIPGQVASLARSYESVGGNVSELAQYLGRSS